MAAHATWDVGTYTFVPTERFQVDDKSPLRQNPRASRAAVTIGSCGHGYEG